MRTGPAHAPRGPKPTWQPLPWFPHACPVILAAVHEPFRRAVILAAPLLCLLFFVTDSFMVSYRLGAQDQGWRTPFQRHPGMVISISHASTSSTAPTPEPRAIAGLHGVSSRVTPISQYRMVPRHARSQRSSPLGQADSAPLAPSKGHLDIACRA